MAADVTGPWGVETTMALYATRARSGPRLNTKQRFQVAQTIVCLAADIQDRKPTYEDVAKDIAGKLRFHVEAIDVARCAKLAGVSWRPRKRSSGTMPRNTLPLLAMRQQRLSRYVAHLYEQLGQPMPDGLREDASTFIPREIPINGNGHAAAG